MIAPMEYGVCGEELTKSFEQCRLTPYQDEAGVWTDGWGNTHGVVPGQDITQEQADMQLHVNLQGSVDCVNEYVTTDLSQHEFEACVDFVFNCGEHAFETSTLLRKLNAGDKEGALAEFDKWIRSGGHVSNGLIRRRDADQALFTKPDEA